MKTPALLSALLLVGTAPELTADQPNIVFILADDMGYGDVGAYGCRDIPTPNLDRLAEEGVRFTSGYSTHPFCSPMRAALMAGRDQHRFGYERNIAYDPQNKLMGLPVSEKTVAARFREAGYATGGIGKWHLGAAAPFAPNNRGFDFFFGFRGGGHRYFDVDLNKQMNEGYLDRLERNGRPVSFEGYLTHALTDAALGFIEDNAERPFFLYLAYNAPHTPLEAPEARVARFNHIQDKKRRVYAAMVSALDDDIGRVLEKLRMLGLRERTLVVFMSDNGGPENSNGSDNGPLRGQKGDVWEGGIRVPFMLAWPGRIPGGQVIDEPVLSIDLMRTGLELAGAPLEARLEGVNLMPRVTGHHSGPIHDAVFWRKEGGVEYAVRSGPWKLVRTPREATLQLFNLEEDIAEDHDLASTHPEQVERLESFYRAWNAHNRPPFFPGYRDYHKLLEEFHRRVSDPDDT